MGSLFLLNLFNIGSLMPEPDNWLFLLCGAIFALYFKLYPKRVWKLRIDHMFIGLASIIVYIVYRGFILVDYSTLATDMMPNPFVFLFFIPTYYILYRLKNYKVLAFILLSTLVFMSGKYTADALPVFMYALYLGFMDKKLGLENDRIMRIIIVFSFMAFLFVPLIELAYPLPHL
jgi:hypothetical protein